MQEVENLNRLKWLDEETLRTTIGTAVKEGSPGDDKTRFVLQDSSDRSTCIAGERRASGETDKDKCDEGTANSSAWTGASSSRKSWTSGWWRVSWSADSRWPSNQAVGRKVKEEMHKAPGRENGKLKAMKRLPSWNRKLEESYQAKEMEHGSAGS